MDKNTYSSYLEREGYYDSKNRRIHNMFKFLVTRPVPDILILASILAVILNLV